MILLQSPRSLRTFDIPYLHHYRPAKHLLTRSRLQYFQVRIPFMASTSAIHVPHVNIGALDYDFTFAFARQPPSAVCYLCEVALHTPPWVVDISYHLTKQNPTHTAHRQFMQPCVPSNPMRASPTTSPEHLKMPAACHQRVEIYFFVKRIAIRNRQPCLTLQRLLGSSVTSLLMICDVRLSNSHSNWFSTLLRGSCLGFVAP
jgi:hypothetical protein